MNQLSKGEKTKQHLYECAIALFREKGYDSVSVDEIVKKAGTAKGTFYVHFQSKASVISEMFHSYDNYYNEIIEEMPSRLTPSEKLEHFIAASCLFTETKIGLDLIRVLYLNQLVSGQVEQDALREDRTLYRILKSLILSGQENGLYRKDLSVEKICRMLVRSIRGTFYEWAMCEGSFSLTEECLSYIRTFVQGIMV